MTDLNERIAALREAVGKNRFVIDHGPNTKLLVVHEALDIIDEQQREIERLREELEISGRVVLDMNADRIHLRERVAELETPPTEQARWMNVSPLRDAGPTELRGRITARNRTDDEGRN